MRALPDILRLCPNAHVMILGGDQVSYAAPASTGKTWRETMLDEVGDRIDHSRVHFLGVLRSRDYLNVLKVSAVHVS